MAFSFNFAGDDIEKPDAEMSDLDTSRPPADTGKDIAMEEQEPAFIAVKAKHEELEVLLASLPSRISYSTTQLTSPRRKKQAAIPRRELFDVKMQLMAEEGSDDERDAQDVYHGFGVRKTAPRRKSSTDMAGLGDSDIEQNVYEGGFKSWEGAVDLARLLLDREVGSDFEAGGNSGSPSYQGRSFLELGCGTALPTLVLFQHALSLTVQGPLRQRLTFTLADYNASVLKLVTAPNLLLTWALHSSNATTLQTALLDRPSSPASSSTSTSEPPSSTSPNSPARDDAPHHSASSDAAAVTPGDLPVTPALLTAFKADLAQRGIDIVLISGSWADTPHFTSLLPELPAQAPAPAPDGSSSSSGSTTPRYLVLAAETIYSPASLRSFTNTLLGILGAAASALSGPALGETLAVVAAKRVYFGVGGGVEEFVELVDREADFEVREVVGSGIAGCDPDVSGGGGGGGGSSGVGRWLGEVSLSTASRGAWVGQKG